MEKKILNYISLSENVKNIVKGSNGKEISSRQPKIRYKNISLKNVQDPTKKMGDGVVGCHEVIIIEC